MENNTIILTGGGTAGHVTLNINLEKSLNKHFDNIIYIGSKTGIEKDLISKNTNYKYLSIPTVKLERKKFFKNFLIPFKLKKAVDEATKILKTYNPQIIFSKGGYVGLPVVIAGHKLKIPIVCHESDITMGLANKLAKKYANVICTNFEITAKTNGKKCTYTGMPLALSKLSKAEAKKALNIETDKPVLLVTGGSLGAKAINEFIFNNIENLTKDYFVIHLVGKNNYNSKIKIKDYLQIEFTNNMWQIMKATDFAISRAGANTIIELLSNEILTIFIPLPKTVSRGDQIENAKFLEKQNLSKTILQEDLTYEKLQKTFVLLKKDANFIKKSIKNAKIEDGTNKIIEIILKEKIH